MLGDEAVNNLLALCDFFRRIKVAESHDPHGLHHILALTYCQLASPYRAVDVVIKVRWAHLDLASGGAQLGPRGVTCGLVFRTS